MRSGASVIVVVGDSIAAGLGVAGHSFADLLNRQPGPSAKTVTVRNFSATGQTIVDGLSLLPQITECRPDWVIVSFGNFDAVVRPVPRAMRWVPPRWRANGWLDPRPFFSRRLLKGLYQRAESAIRWRYRLVLLRVFGGEPATSIAEFDRAARTLVAWVLERTNSKVLLIAPAGIDERFYPGTNASMAACTSAFHAIPKPLGQTQRVIVIDTANLLDRYADFFADGFHPNYHGHRKLAVALIQLLDSSVDADAAKITHDRPSSSL